MPSAVIDYMTTLLGRRVRRRVTKNSDGQNGKSPSVPAAKVGQLTTRTSVSAGTLTMSPGHGIVTGNNLFLFWAGGSRRCVVGTVATNSVPISGGAGDDLPANLTAITACVPQVEEFVVTGNNVVAIGLDCAVQARVAFTAADGTTFQADKGLPDSEDNCYVWDDTNGATSPLATFAVGKVLLGHGDSTRAREVGVGVLYN